MADGRRQGPSGRLLSAQADAASGGERGRAGPPNRGLVTAEEVSELLSVTPAWVLAEARAGRLPHFRLNRQIRFALHDVEAYVAKRRIEARSPLDASDRRVADPTAPQKVALLQGRSGRAHTVPSRTQSPEALFPKERRRGRGGRG